MSSRQNDRMAVCRFQVQLRENGVMDEIGIWESIAKPTDPGTANFQAVAAENSGHSRQGRGRELIHFFQRPHPAARAVDGEAPDLCG
jgi:hypothetical protein